MRKHFTPQSPELTLSIEEEAILIDEQNEVTANLADLDAEADRIIETDASVSDTLQVVSMIPEVGTMESDLIGAVAEMATAGTDANAEDVFDISPEGVSAEGIGASIISGVQKLWESIKAMIAKAWEAIKKFFSNLVMFFSPAKRKRQELEAKLKEEAELAKADNETRQKVADAWWKKNQEDVAQYKAQFFDYKTKNSFFSESDLFFLACQGANVSTDAYPNLLKKTNSYIQNSIDSITETTIKLSDIVIQCLGEYNPNPSNIKSIMEAAAEKYTTCQDDLFAKLKNPDVFGGIRAGSSNFESQGKKVFGWPENYITTSHNSVMGNKMPSKSIKALDKKETEEVDAITDDALVYMLKQAMSDNIKMLDKKSQELIKMLDNLTDVWPTSNSASVEEANERVEGLRLLVRVAKNLSTTSSVIASLTRLSDKVNKAALGYAAASTLHRIGMACAAEHKESPAAGK